MADYSLESYKYAQHLRLYNSEGRENVGASTVWTADDDQYWDFRGSTTGTYTFDATGTLPTEELPLCSFKNGNVIKFRVTNYTPAGGLDDPYYCNFAVNYYDKNGTVIKSTYVNNIPFDSRLNDPDTTQFIYSSPGLYYQLGVSDNPTGFISGGTIYTISKHGIVPGDMPVLPGNMVKVNGLNGAGDWYSQSQVALGFTDFDEFMDTLGDDPSPKKPDDDTSKPDEGDPDYDPNPDPIDFPDLPDDGDALSTGFIAVYQPTSGQLQSLAMQLWSDDFITTFRKAYNDPIEAIVSLHSIPFQIVTGSNADCKIGNYDTHISMLKVAAQYYTINCGTIFVSENWASALDYSPYTQVEIFLPFVGIRPLNIDDIMGMNLQVKYNIDILTGGGIAMIKCADSVLYSFPCEVSQDIPYTMSSKMSLYTNVAQLVVSGVTAMAAPSPGTIGAVASSAINVASGKQTGITRGGTLGGNIGVLGEFTPYLIIHKPIQSLAADFAHKKGYPSNITASLASVSGYTEIDKIHLENIPCTDSERDEIERLLKEGVIL